MFSPPGGVVVRTSRLREDHFGSCHSKACWVQCGGNQCQVRPAAIKANIKRTKPRRFSHIRVFFVCSDDRSAEVFQKRIDTATQMKSVLGANERPNCLIIDEIDGAPAVSSETCIKHQWDTMRLGAVFNVSYVRRPPSTYCYQCWTGKMDMVGTPVQKPQRRKRRKSQYCFAQSSASVTTCKMNTNYASGFETFHAVLTPVRCCSARWWMCDHKDPASHLSLSWLWTCLYTHSRAKHKSSFLTAEVWLKAAERSKLLPYLQKIILQVRLNHSITIIS